MLSAPEVCPVSPVLMVGARPLRHRSRDSNRGRLAESDATWGILLCNRAELSDRSAGTRVRVCHFFTGVTPMTKKAMLDALREAADQGDVKAAWMLRLLASQ